MFNYENNTNLIINNNQLTGTYNYKFKYISKLNNIQPLHVIFVEIMNLLRKFGDDIKIFNPILITHINEKRNFKYKI